MEEATTVMVMILIVLHLLLGFVALQIRDLLAAVIVLAAFSLMSALLFFYLDAPDVALTEAAVGAGVSSFLFVWFVRKTERRDRS